MHLYAEIGLIYIDLNKYKSISNKASESNIAISNHRDEKKGRKCGGGEEKRCEEAGENRGKSLG